MNCPQSVNDIESRLMASCKLLSAKEQNYILRTIRNCILLLLFFSRSLHLR